MKSNDKTKQLLRILKWQALVASSEDNEKMFSVGEFFINFDALARIMLKFAD